MELRDAIKGRRSVREYTGQEVAKPTIHRLIDASIRAPNAVNLQPWTFVVVRDRLVLDDVSRNAKAHLLDTMPPGSQADHFRTLLADPNFHIFYHAPTLIVVFAVEAGPWVVEDCALAAENLMLCAYEEGLGSCWIGFAQAYLNTEDGKRALDLPASWVAVAPIIVGHPKCVPMPVTRREPEIRWVG